MTHQVASVFLFLAESSRGTEFNPASPAIASKTRLRHDAPSARSAAAPRRAHEPGPFTLMSRTASRKNAASRKIPDKPRALRAFGTTRGFPGTQEEVQRRFNPNRKASIPYV